MSSNADSATAPKAGAREWTGPAVRPRQRRLPQSDRGARGPAADATAATGDSLESATVAAQQLPAEPGAQAPAAARDACTSGMNVVAVFCAVIAAVTAVIAMTALRGVGATPQAGAEPAPAKTADADGEDLRVVPER